MVRLGSLAQQDVIQCYPVPAARCWPPKTQQLPTKHEVNAVQWPSLAQVSSIQTNTNNTSWKHDKFWGQPATILFPPRISPSLYLEIGVEKAPNHIHKQVLSRPPAIVDPVTAAETQHPTPVIKYWWVRFYSVTPNSVSQSMHWLSQLFSLAPVSLELHCVELLLSTWNISLKATISHRYCNSTTHFWCDKLNLEWERIALWAEKQTKQQVIKSGASGQRL